MNIRTLKPVLVSWLLTSLLAGCSLSGNETVQSLNGFALGTSYSVKFVSKQVSPERIQLGIDGVLSDVNKRMSTYLPNSELSKISEADADEPVSVSSSTFAVLQSALNIASETGGRFDPTVAPLVDLWGFGPTARNSKVPSAAAVEAIRQTVGYESILLEASTLSVKKADQRQLDLSAIAKGYAVDQVAGYLAEQGIDDFLVEVGGEMRLSGSKPKDEPWRIAIEKPDPEQRSVFRVLPISDAAIATSGDYRNYFEVEGVRYSHTIDPFSGYPVTHNLASVTVVADDCMSADAYATAFLVMGMQEALVFAEDNGIAALFIVNEEGNFLSQQSSEFTERFGFAALE